MSEEFINKYGKLILLMVFLCSACLSGCSWNGTDTHYGDQTVFENGTSYPVHLFVDAQFVQEIASNRACYKSIEKGTHTYSAVSTRTKSSVGGGNFSSGDHITIK